MMQREESGQPHLIGDLFTSEDVAFIHRVLGHELLGYGDLCRILEDESLQEQVLECRCLFDALDAPLLAKDISAFLYYSLTVRQALLEADVRTGELASCLAEALVYLAEARHARFPQLSEGELPPYPVRLTIVKRDRALSHLLLVRAEIAPLCMEIEGLIERETTPELSPRD